MTTASGSRRATVAVAQPMHGAVLRGMGSDEEILRRKVWQGALHGCGQMPRRDDENALGGAERQNAAHRCGDEGFAGPAGQGKELFGPIGAGSGPESGAGPARHDDRVELGHGSRDSTWGSTRGQP